VARAGSVSRIVATIYDRLYAAAGPRGWWPGDGRDEIIIGAVLAQNTAWRNVEGALVNLRRAGLLRLSRLAVARPSTLARLLRPAGYFNLKARRLKAVARFFAPAGRERFEEMAPWPTDRLREELLSVWGVGPETADSILLYALDRLSFVVDAYTLRVVERHGLLAAGSGYEAARSFFSRHTRPDPALYNEYHALLVWVGHHFCKPRPRCAACPLSRRSCFASEAAWRQLASARAEKAMAS